MEKVVTSVKELNSNDERCRWFDEEKLSYEVTTLINNVVEKEIHHIDDEDFLKILEQFKKHIDRRLKKVESSKESLNDKKTMYFFKNIWLYAICFVLFVGSYLLSYIPVEVVWYAEFLSIGLFSLSVIGGFITSALIKGKYEREDNKLQREEEYFKELCQKYENLKQKNLDITRRKIEKLEEEKKRRRHEKQQLEMIMRYRQLSSKPKEVVNDELSEVEQMLYDIHYKDKNLDIPEYLKKSSIRSRLASRYKGPISSCESSTKGRK